MIIVEGPDGAGKTVLVGQLSKAFRTLAMTPDMGAPKGEKEKQKEERRIASTRPRTYRALGEAVRGTRPILHDRLFFSEMVYGPALRGSVQFTARETLFIHDILKTLQCPIIMCLPPFSVVEHNVQNSEDHLEGVTERIQTLYGGYLALAADLAPGALNFIGYDYTREGDSAMVMKKVQKYLDRRVARQP